MPSRSPGAQPGLIEEYASVDVQIYIVEKVPDSSALCRKHLRTVRGKGKAETLREQGQVTRLGTARVVGAHIERLLRRGGFDEALASLNHTLGERPNDIHALVHKAVAFGLSGHHEEALEIYEKVCERYPEDSTASYQRGVASSTAVTVVSVPATPECRRRTPS